MNLLSHAVCTPRRRRLSKKQHIFPMLFAHALVKQQRSESIESFLSELAKESQNTHRKCSLSKNKGTRNFSSNYSPYLESDLLPSELHCLDFEVNPCESRKMWNTCGLGQVQAQEFPALVFGGLPFLSLHLISSTGRVLGVFSSRMSCLPRTTNVLYNRGWPLSRSGVKLLTPLVGGKHYQWGPVSRGWQGTKLSGATAAACVWCYFGVVVFVIGPCTRT